MTGMATRPKRRKRDVEKNYPRRQFISKLRRLADALEQGRRFRIQIAGERVSIPPTAAITLEHERDGSDEEIEFQMKWSVAD
jgi:amphi-Trp domain-containing protein